jgi:hypothetical protein
MASENSAPGLTQVGRGVQASDVELAADSLLREGLRPTVDRIRTTLGRGSPNTITPLLDAWWKGLAPRLAGGPDFADRVPREAFHLFETLWVRLRIAAEQRAAGALAYQRLEVDRTAQRVDLKSEVLSLREAELQEQLQRRATQIERLEMDLGEAQRQRALSEARAASRERRVTTIEKEFAALQTKFVRVLAGVVGKRSRPARPKAKVNKKASKRRKRSSKILRRRI